MYNYYLISPNKYDIILFLLLNILSRKEISAELGQKTIPRQLYIEEITRIKISRVDH